VYTFLNILIVVYLERVLMENSPIRKHEEKERKHCATRMGQIQTNIRLTIWLGIFLFLKQAPLYLS
jgi:hypothetical protein